jgi:hypothetical protein
MTLYESHRLYVAIIVTVKAFGLAVHYHRVLSRIVLTVLCFQIILSWDGRPSRPSKPF